jgi:hypothetical protein
LRFDADTFVPHAERARLATLPGAVEIRDRTVPMHYEVEDTPGGPLGVVRLVIPEKVARGLAREELPDLDRPVRFTVTRGARGSVKAASLDELGDALARPFTDEEARTPQGRGHFGSRGAQPSRGPASSRGSSDDRGARPAHHGKPGGHDKASHRPGSPAGRGKRRGKRR